MNNNKELIISICETSKAQLEYNKKVVEHFAKERGVEVEIRTYRGESRFMLEFDGNEQLDIILLNADSMELANHIRSNNDKVDIIFINGDLINALQGYKVRAFDYLLKESTGQDLLETLNRWIDSRREEDSEYLVLKRYKKHIKINCNDIQYVISTDHYVDVYTNGEIYTFKQSISKVEKMLPQNKFCRCHRSYLVNLDYVDNITTGELVLRDDVKIPMSKSKKVKTRTMFEEYYKINK